MFEGASFGAKSDANENVVVPPPSSFESLCTEFEAMQSESGESQGLLYRLPQPKWNVKMGGWALMQAESIAEAVPSLPLWQPVWVKNMLCNPNIKWSVPSEESFRCETVYRDAGCALPACQQPILLAQVVMPSSWRPHLRLPTNVIAHAHGIGTKAFSM